MSKITVFTSNSCGQCKTLKGYLNNKNLKFSEVNVEDNPKAHQEIYKLSGVLSTPVTLIEKDNQKNIVVGLNISSLSSILA